MSAQINHVAIVSDNYAQLAKFYEAMFGMKSSGLQRSASAVTVGDGYVGLNINPRRAGRSAGTGNPRTVIVSYGFIRQIRLTRFSRRVEGP